MLNAAPVAVAGRVLGTRQVVLDRDPFSRHRYESATARLFQDFRIREHRLLAERADDLHPDGQRVATAAAPDQASSVGDHVVFVFNFGEHLRTIAPGTR